MNGLVGPHDRTGRRHSHDDLQVTEKHKNHSVFDQKVTQEDVITRAQAKVKRYAMYAVCFWCLDSLYFSGFQVKINLIFPSPVCLFHQKRI